MKCNIESIENCLNCPYPDCINEARASKIESALVEKYHAPALTKKQIYEKERRRAYYMAHRAEIQEYMKKYRAANRESLIAYRRAYYVAHREEELERQKRYDRMKKGAENAS